MKLNKTIDILAIIVMGLIFSRLFTVLFTTKPILGLTLSKETTCFISFIFLYLSEPHKYILLEP